MTSRFIEEQENIDGVRLSFNVLPSSKLEQIKMIIPLGVMYSPLNRAEEMTRVSYPPLACRNESCGAILSPWCEVDLSQQIWICPHCLTRNGFPPGFNAAERVETQSDMTTIEYEPSSEGSGSPAFLFCVDTAVMVEELEQIKQSIAQALTLLPPDAMVGLITFGKHVHLHEVGFIECPKTVVFRGDVIEKDWEKKMTVERIRELLKLSPMADGSVNPANILRFLQPLGEVYDAFNELVESIGVDKWKKQKACRAERCTGVAALVGSAVLGALISGFPARLMMFTGGPCTVGPGTIVDLPLSSMIRAHRDITKGKAPHFDKACAFYAGIGRHAAENGHVIDLFACCLDQTGVAEMRSVCDNTGGVLVLSDTFTTSVFKTSFSQVFAMYATGELSMCFNAEISVRCSRQLKIHGCVGPVTAMEEKTPSNCVSKRSFDSMEMGVGNTCRWSLGGLNPNTTMCFILDIAPSQRDSDISDSAHLQFVTTYKTSYGSDVTRVTTISLRMANTSKKEGMDQVIAGMDEEACATVLCRWLVYRSDNEFDPDLMSWLDKKLIQICSKFGNYQVGDADSFRMCDQLSNFPQFVYYMRRSQFLHVFNYSPDETAFFRATLMRENVVNSMSMIQPLLHAYTMDSEEPMPVLLELASRHPDRILLLDTFFHLVIWYGRNIAQWRDDKISETDPENYGWFSDMLQQPKDECAVRSGFRFPYPNIIECDEGSGQQRFLIAKLNPDNRRAETRSEAERVTGDVMTDDIPLAGFMDHLKRIAVSPHE